MTIYQVIKKLLANVWYLILLPIGAGGLVFSLTGNLPVKFTTQATIFTGITSNTGIENLGNSRVDYFATQNAYNNILSIINSENVLKETSIRLLTLHLVLNKPQKDIISAESFEEFQEIIPKEIKDLIVQEDYEQTYENIWNSIVQNENNFVYNLLYNDHPHYSIKALSKIKTVRVSSSDLVQVSYENNDPGVCYQTVKILLNVFISKYDTLKRSQTGSAVAYFETQLEKSANRLKNSENLLLKFNTKNEVINYYEQTKHVSSQQEKIEMRLQEIHMENEAAKAILKRLETETKNRFKIQLNSQDLLTIRKQLTTLNDQLTLLELKNQTSDSLIVEKVRAQKTQLERRLNNKIDSIYAYKNRSEGIGASDILKQWLAAATEYESTHSRLKAIRARKIEFMKLYAQYAPLGAKLKRIEREIKVNEEEYLEILHHLGLARLKQQNANIQGDMKILDEAKFPIKASASKRKIFVVIAALFSLIFFTLGLFILELLDQRIKSPERLKRIAGLETISGFCAKDQDQANLEQLNHRAASFIFERMKKAKMLNQNKTTRILLVSNWKGDGKSYIIEQLEQLLQTKGFTYNSTTVHQSTTQSEANFELIEHTPISDGIEYPEIFSSIHLCLFAVDASATWKSVDDFYLSRFNEFHTDAPLAVLTKAQPDDLESLYGSIQKRRNFIRRYVKQKLLKRFF